MNRGSAMTEHALREVAERLRSDRAFQRQLYLSPLEALSGYDLTRDERMLLMLPNFSWVIPNRLAGSARPLHPDAIEAFSRRGVAAVVSLTEEPLPAELVRRAGLECAHVPVVDFTAPTLAQLEEAIAAIDGFLEQERPVAVHCAAGMGRTGTILACYLVRQGMSAADAITSVRERRPQSIETPEQEAAVAMYQRHLTRTTPTRFQ
jgi:atypical dual specificity phosphatase